MKRWQPPVFSLLSLFVALSPVWGNGAAPPRPVPLPEAKAVKFVVVVDERVTEPRLVVPKSMLGEKKSASLDLSTIVAGIALTLALVSGGLLLVRRGSPRIVAGALALSVLAFGATTLFAQSTNPGNTGATNINFNFNQAVRPAVVTPVSLPANIVLGEKMQVEFVEKGDEIKLLVSKDMVKREVKPKPKDEKEE